MKNRASAIVKQIIKTLADIVRSKTTTFRNRTKAFKTRMVIFSLIHNRKFLISSISQKLSSRINHDDRKPEPQIEEEEEEEEEVFDDGEGESVIDLVKRENGEEEFRLEDEIDRVADLFIERFHRQMRLQKQLSFEDTPTHD